jgi:hypothetical protein
LPRPRRRPTTPRADHGQATVEFALSLPLLVVALLGVVQFVVVVRDQLAIEVAARTAARAASVGGPDAAVPAAEATTTLRPLDVDVEFRDRDVVVTVRHRTRTDVAVIGAFVGDVGLRATVTMLREPPAPP